MISEDSADSQILTSHSDFSDRYNTFYRLILKRKRLIFPRQCILPYAYYSEIRCECIEFLHI